MVRLGFRFSHGSFHSIRLGLLLLDRIGLSGFGFFGLKAGLAGFGHGSVVPAFVVRKLAANGRSEIDFRLAVGVGHLGHEVRKPVAAARQRFSGHCPSPSMNCVQSSAIRRWRL